ncbi:MAG: DUF2208 family protein [Thermofilaceae archaeon]
MKTWINALISLALLVAFSYVSSNHPEFSSWFFIIYMVAMLIVTTAIAGRSAATLLRDAEFVKSGKPLLTISKEEATRLRARDRELEKELSKQAKPLIIQPLVLFALLFVFIVPGLRDTLVTSLSDVFFSFFQNQRLQLFAAFTALYGTFMTVSYLTNYVINKSLQKMGGKLEVPAYYMLTDKGLILEDRIPLKAPLKVEEMKVDARRRYVEIKLRSIPAAGGSTGRIRLYTDNPRELENRLRILSEQSG